MEKPPERGAAAGAQHGEPGTPGVGGARPPRADGGALAARCLAAECEPGRRGPEPEALPPLPRCPVLRGRPDPLPLSSAAAPDDPRCPPLFPAAATNPEEG